MIYLDELKEMRTKLIRYWKFLRFNYEKLRIYKGNPGIDRDNEMILHRAREYIEKSKLKLEIVIQDIDEKIKTQQQIYDLWNDNLIKKLKT